MTDIRTRLISLGGHALSSMWRNLASALTARDGRGQAGACTTTMRASPEQAGAIINNVFGPVRDPP
jgi:hypothetical protein